MPNRDDPPADTPQTGEIPSAEPAKGNGHAGGHGPVALDNPFWSFSVTVYEEATVRDACLDLQDRDGADVNLLLLTCWLGFLGVRLDSKGIERLDRLVSPWRGEAVQPLRALRRRLKAPLGPVGPDLAADVRQLIGKAELEAERLQQAVLYRALETLPGTDARGAERSGVARLNLNTYLGWVTGSATSGETRAALEALIGGCRLVLDGPDEDEEA